MAERWLLLALPLALTGCFGKADDDDDDDDGGGDEASDSGWTDDGGTDGGGSDGGGGSTGACPDLMPLHRVGQVATHEYLDGTSVTGGFVMTYLGEETVDGESAWRLRTDAAYSGEGFEAEYRADTWYRCDAEGAWPLYQTVDSTTSYGGTSYEYTAETTWTEPGLAMPRDVAVGTEWTQRYTSVTTDGDGATTELSYSIEHVVVGKETVEVPAGTFEAFHLEQTTEDGRSEWYAAPDVGSVLSDSAWLVDLE